MLIYSMSVSVDERFASVYERYRRDRDESD
jgi:hypothetical protein